MELKLAKSSYGAKFKEIKIEEIEEKLNKERFFYFARENEHKDLNAMLEYFEEKGHIVLMKEVKYGLGDSDYIYEVHII